MQQLIRRQAGTLASKRVKSKKDDKTFVAVDIDSSRKKRPFIFSKLITQQA